MGFGGNDTWGGARIICHFPSIRAKEFWERLKNDGKRGLKKGLAFFLTGFVFGFFFLFFFFLFLSFFSTALLDLIISHFFLVFIL